MLLNCGHTICRNCFEGGIGPQDHTIRCPYDYRQFKATLDMILPNYHLIDIMKSKKFNKGFSFGQALLVVFCIVIALAILAFTFLKFMNYEQELEAQGLMIRSLLSNQKSEFE